MMWRNRVSYSKEQRQRQKDEELPLITVDMLKANGARITFQGIVSEKALKVLYRAFNRVIDMGHKEAAMNVRARKEKKHG